MIVLRSIALAAFAALATGSAALAADSLVLNGSLNGPVARATAPANWTSVQGSVDVMDAQNNVGMAGYTYFGAAPEASPDGGTWVGLGADTNLVEQFGQTISGLTVGQQYTVSWLAGNFGYSRGSVQYLGSNAIDVLTRGKSIAVGDTLALGSSWRQQSASFVAAATSVDLSFKLATSTKAYLSIDGVAMQATVVPEPATWALMGLALAGLSVVTRRTRAAR